MDNISLHNVRIMLMYNMRQKKRVASCAQSRVAAVHINLRITCVRPRMLIEQFLYTKNKEQPKLGAQYSNSRGIGLL